MKPSSATYKPAADDDTCLQHSTAPSV